MSIIFAAILHAMNILERFEILESELHRSNSEWKSERMGSNLPGVMKEIVSNFVMPWGTQESSS